LGEKEVDEEPVAYLLAFLSSVPCVEIHLTSLPFRLPTRYRRFVVACPTYTPSLEQIQLLEKLGATLFRLSTQDHFCLPDGARTQQMAVRLAPNGGFQHSENYRWIQCRGREFNLSPLQAEVVRILHRAQEAGAPGLTWHELSHRLSGNASCMSDIFKKSDPRSQLITYIKRGRLYRLNV
jgi:hypothetical protein